MIVNIQSNEVLLNEKSHQQIIRKIKLGLTRLEPYIKTLSIDLSIDSSFEDANYTHCRLTITAIDMPNIIIEDTQIKLSFVIDRVIQKAIRMMNRKLERNK